MSIHFTIPLYGVPSLKVSKEELAYWVQLLDFIPYASYNNNPTKTKSEIGIIAIRIPNQRKVFHPLLRLICL